MWYEPKVEIRMEKGWKEQWRCKLVVWLEMEKELAEEFSEGFGNYVNGGCRFCMKRKLYSYSDYP